MAWVRAPAPRSCVPRRCWGQGTGPGAPPGVAGGNLAHEGQGGVLGPLKVPGFVPGATHGTTGLSAWPRSCTRLTPERCWGGAGDSVGGSALVGTGLPPLSVPAQGATGSLQTRRGQGTPRAGLCQGLRWEPGRVDSSDVNHTGRLPVRRHRLSHRCWHRAGHGGWEALGRVGVPPQLPTSPFLPLGHPGQCLHSTAVGPERC